MSDLNAWFEAQPFINNLMSAIEQYDKTNKNRADKQELIINFLEFYNEYQQNHTFKN